MCVCVCIDCNICIDYNDNKINGNSDNMKTTLVTIYTDKTNSVIPK